MHPVSFPPPIPKNCVRKRIGKNRPVNYHSSSKWPNRCPCVTVFPPVSKILHRQFALNHMKHRKHAHYSDHRDNLMPAASICFPVEAVLRCYRSFLDPSSMLLWGFFSRIFSPFLQNCAEFRRHSDLAQTVFPLVFHRRTLRNG